MNYSVYESKEKSIVHRRVIPTGKEEGVEELLLLPTKIEAAGVENASCLLLPRPSQLIYSDATPFARVDSGATLILDFGEEQNGGVRIFTDCVPVGATVRVRFGESYAECHAELGEDNATNDHAVRDVTLPLSAYAETAFGNDGLPIRSAGFFLLGHGTAKKRLRNLPQIAQKTAIRVPRNGTYR